MHLKYLMNTTRLGQLDEKGPFSNKIHKLLSITDEPQGVEIWPGGVPVEMSERSVG